MTILIFVLGNIIGSFLNVCICRIPRGQSIVYPQSHCPNCSTLLKWYELIPLVSFIIQCGRCRYCRERISLQYLMVEFFNGLLYLILFLEFGFTIDFIFYAIISSILLVISYIDLYHQIIPDILNILIILIATVYKILKFIFCSIPLNIGNSLMGLIVSSMFFLLIIIISKGGMGGGDMKLIGGMGFILGIQKIVLTIFVSFLFGGIISLIILLLKIKDKKDPISFGPFICLAFMTTIFLGDSLLYWYINRFY